MKNKKLYNKIQSNSVKKNHLKIKSMKLNDLYFRNRHQNDKKTLELTGTNTLLNNKFKSFISSNYTLPSLILNTKKLYNHKRKGYLIKPFPHFSSARLITRSRPKLQLKNNCSELTFTADFICALRNRCLSSCTH